MAGVVPSSGMAQFNDPYDSMVNSDQLIYGLDNSNIPDNVKAFIHDGTTRTSGDLDFIRDANMSRAETQSARAYETWFDSTAVQRRVKDIEAAGLNPWLALQSGGISANGSSHVNSGSSGRSKSKDSEKTNAKDMFSSALKVAAFFKFLLA